MERPSNGLSSPAIQTVSLQHDRIGIYREHLPGTGVLLPNAQFVASTTGFQNNLKGQSANSTPVGLNSTPQSATSGTRHTESFIANNGLIDTNVRPNVSSHLKLTLSPHVNRRFDLNSHDVIDTEGQQSTTATDVNAALRPSHMEQKKLVQLPISQTKICDPYQSLNHDSTKETRTKNLTNHAQNGELPRSQNRTVMKREGLKELPSLSQSADVTRFMQRTQREPRRRAVVIGINYVFAPDILLRGCCNDATAMALSLINLCDFKPQDVILLIDAYPSSCYRSPNLEERDDEEPDGPVLWKDRQPTRRNILLALNWLRADTLPGDVLLFYFAGHGIQLDDMSGWEGEGYDEAILPMDFFGEEVNALTAVMLRNLLLSVCSDVQLTIVIDCTGGQTILDPSGTGGWSFIKGIKQKGVWPFVTDATDKVARAKYDSSAWIDGGMKRRGARPRFVPGVDVSSTQELLDPTLQKPASQIGAKVKGFLFAAAPWGQVAIEARMPAIALNPITRRGDVLFDTPVIPRQGKRSAYHGVFSWVFINSLRDLMVTSVAKNPSKSVTYQQLLQEIDLKIRYCRSREGGLTKLSQSPELTFYRAGSGESTEFILWPFGGKRKSVPFATKTHLDLPCVPHETRYLSPWEAEEQLNRAAELKRENDPTLRMLRRPVTLQLPQPAQSSTVVWQQVPQMFEMPKQTSITLDTDARSSILSTSTLKRQPRDDPVVQLSSAKRHVSRDNGTKFITAINLRSHQQQGAMDFACRSTQKDDDHEQYQERIAIGNTKRNIATATPVGVKPKTGSALNQNKPSSPNQKIPKHQTNSPRQGVSRNATFPSRSASQLRDEKGHVHVVPNEGSARQLSSHVTRAITATTAVSSVANRRPNHSLASFNNLQVTAASKRPFKASLMISSVPKEHLVSINNRSEILVAGGYPSLLTPRRLQSKHQGTQSYITLPNRQPSRTALTEVTRISQKTLPNIPLMALPITVNPPQIETRLQASGSKDYKPNDTSPRSGNMICRSIHGTYANTPQQANETTPVAHQEKSCSSLNCSVRTPVDPILQLTPAAREAFERYARGESFHVSSDKTIGIADTTDAMRVSETYTNSENKMLISTRPNENINNMESSFEIHPSRGNAIKGLQNISSLPQYSNESPL